MTADQPLLIEVPATVSSPTVTKREPVAGLNRIVVFTWFAPRRYWKLWETIESHEQLSKFRFPRGHSHICVVEVKIGKQ